MSKELSLFIQREIQKRGISERELSRQAGLSETAVYYIINRPESRPTLETCISLAKALTLPEKVLLQLAGYSELEFPQSLNQEVAALAVYLNEIPERLQQQALEACWTIVRLVLQVAEDSKSA